LTRGKHFLGLALKQYCPNTRHEKLKGLCKTPSVERHSCLETFGELYEHVATYLDPIVNPHVCPEVNEIRWNWDSDTKTTAHGLKSSLQSFGVVGFTLLKNSLDYLKGLSAKLQRRDIEVFGGYTMIDNIKSEIQCLRNDIGVEFQRLYDEAKYIDTTEEMPRVPRV